jgi:hypothetical protein
MGKREQEAYLLSPLGEITSDLVWGYRKCSAIILQFTQWTKSERSILYITENHWLAAAKHTIQTKNGIDSDRTEALANSYT